jgi:hypothetical protein
MNVSGYGKLFCVYLLIEFHYVGLQTLEVTSSVLKLLACNNSNN